MIWFATCTKARGVVWRMACASPPTVAFFLHVSWCGNAGKMQPSAAGGSEKCAGVRACSGGVAVWCTWRGSAVRVVQVGVRCGVVKRQNRHCPSPLMRGCHIACCASEACHVVQQAAVKSMKIAEKEEAV